MSCVLACDLGGSSFRAALVDERGATLCSHAIPSQLPETIAGKSEIDPDTWWAAFETCVSALQLVRPHDFAKVQAIAISAMTRSQVFIDRQHNSIRPAILWADTRADQHLPSLRKICGTAHPEAEQLNAFHPLARIWWLKQQEPTQFDKVAHVLDPKDYLHLKLTGRVASDRISVARLAAAVTSHNGAPSMFDAAGISPALLPPLQEPLSIMGRVQAGLPGALEKLAGVPVITMANDTWASVVGLGAMRAGVAYNLSGTTEVFGLVKAASAMADGLLTVDWSEGLTQLGGPSLAGGDTVTWLLDMFRRPNDPQTSTQAELAALLSSAQVGAPLVFLPYLRGERVPHWDSSLRGAWVGLNRQHGPADLARAVLEGVGFLNRIVLERAELATGQAVTEVRFGGGGAANPFWCQIKADILNRPVVVTSEEQTGLRGAAIVAWTALGRFPDLASAQSALVQTAHIYQPNADQRLRYDTLLAIFKDTEAALAPISRRLAALGVAAETPKHV